MEYPFLYYLADISGLCRSNPNHFKMILLKNPPADLFSQEAPGLFQEHYEIIAKNIHHCPDLVSLFHLFLIAGYLKHQDRIHPDTHQFFLDQFDFQTYLGFHPELSPGTWCSVPVILTDGELVHIRYFILGMQNRPADSDLIPSWSVPLFDPDALAAVRNAASASLTRPGMPQTADLFCFPLTTPVSLSQISRSVRFQGKSLGLPLALGFAALLDHKEVPAGLAATGAVSADGTVQAVGHLEQKISGILPRYQALLFPRANTKLTESKKLVCLPVSSLDQAYMLFSLYSPDRKKKLPLLSACFQDPKILAENIGILPPKWIEWMEDNKTMTPIMEKLLKRPDLFTILSKTFEKKVLTFDLAHAAAIEHIVKQDSLSRLSEKVPLSVFRWCTTALSLANHLGRIQDSVAWEKRGGRLINTMMKTDIQPVTEFFNNSLVARHNRYSFSHKLPAKMEELLGLLETLYHCKSKFGCKTDMVLGRLYGTLMQHNGFCGPGRLRQANTYHKKACRALGQDRVPEYRDEWRRQYNYLTYAFMDAGRTRDAAQSLKLYFGIPDHEPLYNFLAQRDRLLTHWEIALLARYIAQDRGLPDRKKMYRLLTGQFVQNPDAPHPGQLIAYNLGQTAFSLGEKAKAITLMNQSIALCFSPKSGPTIVVMALLPLSNMPDDTLPGATRLAGWESKIRRAATQLNVYHFNFLLNNSLAKACSLVRKNPEVYFPFTYR